MDDYDGDSGDSAGYPSHGPAGRRPVCHLGLKRSVPENHQPEQSSGKAFGAGRSGYYRPQREADAAGSGGCLD